MKNLIIVGAGGMGRCVYNTAIQCHGYGKDYQIKGFIDDNLNALYAYCEYPAIIGKITDYVIQSDDVFVIALGTISYKKRCVENLLNRGAEFITLLHPTSIVNSNAKLGRGCIIDSFTVIGADTIIGDFTVISVGVVVGHDVEIGEWSHIDSHVTLVGGVSVEEEVCVHTGAIINHKVRIEKQACIGAGSFVIRNVLKGITVYGNPATRLV